MARFDRRASPLQFRKDARPQGKGIAAKRLAVAQDKAGGFGKRLETQRAKGRAAIGSDQGAGVIGGQIVDQAGAYQARGKLAAAFAQDARQPSPCKGLKRGGGIHLSAGGCGNFDQRCARGRPGRAGA